MQTAPGSTYIYDVVIEYKQRGFNPTKDSHK